MHFHHPDTVNNEILPQSFTISLEAEYPVSDLILTSAFWSKNCCPVTQEETEAGTGLAYLEEACLDSLGSVLSAHPVQGHP